MKDVNDFKMLAAAINEALNGEHAPGIPPANRFALLVSPQGGDAVSVKFISNMDRAELSDLMSELVQFLGTMDRKPTAH